MRKKLGEEADSKREPILFQVTTNSAWVRTPPAVYYRVSDGTCIEMSSNIIYFCPSFLPCKGFWNLRRLVETTNWAWFFKMTLLHGLIDIQWLASHIRQQVSQQMLESGPYGRIDQTRTAWVPIVLLISFFYLFSQQLGTHTMLMISTTQLWMNHTFIYKPNMQAGVPVPCFWCLEIKLLGLKLNKWENYQLNPLIKSGLCFNMIYLTNEKFVPVLRKWGNTPRRNWSTLCSNVDIQLTTLFTSN